MNTADMLNRLIEKQSLTSVEAEIFLNDVMQDRISPVQLGAILVALRMKGESSEEIVGFIKAMRKNMIRVKAHNAIDVCGTGGDGRGTFNISTAVACVVAGAGVKVAKHGNRAASSKCGSADVLEELGINLQLSSQEAEDVLNKVGMVFLFAPLFHPAMKNVVAVRKELKIRTVFNFLGPFINPANVERQLIGVPGMEIAKELTEVAKKFDYKHLLIVTSEDGLDEVSTTSKSTLFEVKNNLVKQSLIDPAIYGFKRTSKEKLLGGSARQNAILIRELLQGKKDAKSDIVLFNSAFALFAAGAVADIKEGIKLAEKSIDTGAAISVLKNLVKETRKYA